jgi:predicted PurR-regulated permease PerM
MNRPSQAFNWPALLGSIALLGLGVLAWELRWVLLVLFGAIVMAVALDVPVQILIRRLKLKRPQALLVVLVLLCSLGWELGTLLLPDLLEQIKTLNQLLPILIQKLFLLTGEINGLQDLQIALKSLNNS